MSVRRVVTGQKPDGTSVFVTDAEVSSVELKRIGLARQPNDEYQLL